MSSYSFSSILQGLVCFDGISTIVGYLMPNPFYSYKVKLWVGVKGDSKAAFSIAVGKGATHFLWLHHFTLDFYFILLRDKEVSSTISGVFYA